MKRIELFEFEDFSWLPAVIRTGATNLIVVFHNLMGTAVVLSDLILSVRKKCEFNQVVDLGSGSGGAMIDAFKMINQSDIDEPIKLILTDLYPNTNTVEEINNRQLEHIEYHYQSVDATNIAQTPKGLKTMIASFHHMKPEIARKILKSAEQSKEPILIYEVAKNNIPTLVWWIFLPVSLLILFVMSLIMTLFVKKVSITQLFFTYIIPIIPIVYAWDGQASLMRTYTFDDIKKLLGDSDPNYHWDIEDTIKPNGKKAGYHIIGYPA